MEEEINNICRVCLSFEGSYCGMKANGLDYVFEQLTGLQANADDRLPRFLCKTCSNELRSYQQFRLTSKQSNDLLHEVLMRFQYITKDYITSIKNEKALNSISFKIEENHDTLICMMADQHALQSEFKTECVSEIDINENLSDSDCDALVMDIPTSHIDATTTNITTGVDALTTEIDAEPDNDTTTKTDAKTKKASTKKKKRLKESKSKVKNVKQKTISNELIAKLIKTCFNIKQLTYEEQIENMRKKQDIPTYRTSLFKCLKCYTSFVSEAAYDNHMVQHTDAWGPYECDICKARFKNKWTLAKHITLGPHWRKFECKQCELVTVYRSTAVQHAQWHKGKLYQCKHCDLQFSRQTTYMNHVRVKHASEVCVVCGHSFVTNKGLMMHKMRQHRLNEQVPADGPQCVQCDIRFSSEDALNTHLNVSPKHVTENTHWLTSYTYTAGKKTGRQRAKRKVGDSEMTTSDPSEAVTCEQCGKLMKNTNSYLSHFRRKHYDKTRTQGPTASPSMCDTCGRMFQNPYRLKAHIQLHSEEKPFKCPECAKRFRTNTYLQAHMKCHESKLSNVTYPCGLCGVTFTRPGNRQKHVKMVHSDNRPFPCDICGKAFKSKCDRKAHTDYVHHKKPWPKRTRQKKAAASRENEMAVGFDNYL